MQINPCVKWAAKVCSLDSIRTYSGNLACGALVLRECYAKTGAWHLAIRCYNGSGRSAEEYMHKALAYIGWLTLQERRSRDGAWKESSGPAR